MADTIASLGIEVTQKGVKEAQESLGRLGVNAKAAERAVRSYKTETQSNTQAQKQYTEQQQKANTAVSRAEQIHKSARGGFRAMRGATQQLSFQLQDVAVQAQMGTDGLRILSQQGPQILSIFGPGGAIAGAAIAFGALIGSVLTSAFTDAEGGSDALDAAIQRLDTTFSEAASGALELSERIRKLAGSSEKAAMAELASLMAEARNVVFKTRKEMLELADTSVGIDLSQLQMGLEEVRRAGLRPEDVLDQKSFSEAGGVLNATLDTFRHNLGLNRAQALTLATAIENVDPTNGKTFDPLLGALDDLSIEVDIGNAAFFKFRNQMSSLADQARVAGEQLAFVRRARRALREEGAEGLDPLTEGAEDDREAEDKVNKRNALVLARQKEAAQKRLEQIMIAAQTERNAVLEIEKNKQEQLQQDLNNGLITHQEHAEGLINLGIATSQRLAAIDERARKDQEDRDKKSAIARIRLENFVAQQRGSIMNQTLTLIGDAFGKESGLYKAMFIASQGLAIAQTIMNANVAATAALAPPPVGLGPVAGVPYSKAIRTMGYVSAGLIAAQTFAGFSGGRATGGQVLGGQTYLVGERGPELLTMGGTGRVASNDQLKQAIGGGESIQIVNNIDARGAGPDVDNKIRQAMKETSAITMANVQNLMRRRRFT